MNYERLPNTLGELHYYDAEGYAISNPYEVQEFLYSIDFLHDVPEDDITIIYVSGQSKMAWYSTEQNPDGAVIMHELF